MVTFPASGVVRTPAHAPTPLDAAIAAHLAHPAMAGDPWAEMIQSQFYLAPREVSLRPGWENEPADPPHAWWLYAAAFFVAIAASALLTGCGGGDVDDDLQPQRPTPVVDCKASPGACR